MKQLLWGLIFSVALPCLAFSQGRHLRVYAVALANDSAGASLGASSSGSGLYVSDDTGHSFRHVGWDNVKSYSMNLVRRDSGRVLYLATGLGVLRSRDWGQHWKQLTDWRVSEVMDIAVNQAHPGELWIATAHGPWHSTDSGASWVADGRGMKTPYCSRVMYDSSDYRQVALAGEDGLYLRDSGSNAWHAVARIDRPVRAIAQYIDGWNVEGEGISAHVAHDTVTALRHRDETRWAFSIDPTYAVEKRGWSYWLFGGPNGAEAHRKKWEATYPVKNVAATLLVAPEWLLGTLGNGVYIGSQNRYVLGGREIWTLMQAMVNE